MSNTFRFAAIGDTITLQAAVPLAMGVKQGAGVSGLLAMGCNIHSWPWTGSVGTRFLQLGAKAMRISGGPQTTIDAALANGIQTVIINAHQGDTAAAKALALANARYGPRVIIENGNEPRPGTFAQYLADQIAFAQAARAGSPDARIAALQTNHNYTPDRIADLRWFLAQPGALDAFNVATLHPYYQRPEASYANDIGPFIGTVADAFILAGRPVPEFAVGEVGWSDAIGRLTNATDENTGPIGQTHLQPREWAANYCSRFIPLMRAAPRLRTATLYSLSDEGPSDPAFTSIEAHFGLFAPDGPKPAFYVAKDLFARCHAAAESAAYTRGADWFVRNTVGASQELLAWSPGGAKQAAVVVDAPQGGTLSFATAGETARGNSPATIPLDPGRQSVRLPIGVRSLMVWADRPVAFAEFT